MAILDFPSGAGNGQIFTATNGIVYQYDGVRWIGINGYVGSGGSGGNGFVGSQGDAGTPGDVGFVGSQGDVGFVGSQGDAGTPGDVGFVGSQGDVGFIGSQGDAGTPGDVGFVGSQGDVGFVGSQGDLGYVGSQGDVGFIGSQGDLGYVGSQGPIGSMFSAYYGAFHADSTTNLTDVMGSNSTTPIQVTSTAGFESSGYLLIGSEIIQYTSVTSTTFEGTITRGVGSSTKSTHDIGDGVGMAQYAPALTTATVYMDITDYSNGVSLASPIDGSVKITNAGLYNIQLSVQAINTGNAYDDLKLWLAVNGTHVPSTMGTITVAETHAQIPGSIIASWNYLYQFNANDVFSLEWQTRNGDISIDTFANPAGNDIPAAPAVIVTVVQVA